MYVCAGGSISHASCNKAEINSETGFFRRLFALVRRVCDFHGRSRRASVSLVFFRRAFLRRAVHSRIDTRCGCEINANATAIGIHHARGSLSAGLAARFPDSPRMRAALTTRERERERERERKRGGPGMGIAEERREAEKRARNNNNARSRL